MSDATRAGALGSFCVHSANVCSGLRTCRGPCGAGPFGSPPCPWQGFSDAAGLGTTVDGVSSARGPTCAEGPGGGGGLTPGSGRGPLTELCLLLLMKRGDFPSMAVSPSGTNANKNQRSSEHFPWKSQPVAPEQRCRPWPACRGLPEAPPFCLPFPLLSPVSPSDTFCLHLIPTCEVRIYV